jgi:hypothetical protein
MPIAAGAVDAAIEVLKATSYNPFPTRISIGAPTATAYFWMVRSVGRVWTPLSRRETTLLVVPHSGGDVLLRHSHGSPCCYEVGHKNLQCSISLEWPHRLVLARAHN